MSGLVLRKLHNYETDVPRCSNCTHFQNERWALTTDSNTRRVSQRCKLHGFNVSPNGVCDSWQHKTKGDTLK